MDLSLLPPELLYELFTYCAVSDLKRLLVTNKSVANLLFSYFEAQRRVINYCLVSNSGSFKPTYEPLGIIPDQTSSNIYYINIFFFNLKFSQIRSILT